MELKYGRGSIGFEPGPGVVGVVEPRPADVRPVEDLLKQSFASPIGQDRLRAVLRRNKPGDVVIIVSDITRKIANYEEILKFLVAELVDGGIDEKNITFVVALGTHRVHTAEENKRLYGALLDNFDFLDHDCRGDVVLVGKTSTGLEVSVNRRVEEADFVIATGRVDFHYLAGYSGGRKSVLPGVASYETIRRNHSKLVRNGVFVARGQGNIIAEEMAEAARLLGIDHLLNVVETPQRETSMVFCGDSESAFNRAVDCLIEQRRSILAEPADCAVVSAGGFPNDRDFYHTHKAMNLAMLCLKPRGTIVLAGECGDGVGNEPFARLMTENDLDALLHYPEERIEVGGHRAFLTAKILKDHRVYACTGLDPDTVRRMKFTPVQSIDQGIDGARSEHGNDMKMVVVPNGGAVLPVFGSPENKSSHTGG